MEITILTPEKREIDVTFPAYFEKKDYNTFRDYFRVENEKKVYQITIYENGDVALLEKPTVDAEYFLSRPDLYVPITHEDFLVAVNSVKEFLKQF